ncbi:MAG: aminotransferase class I/II-fold pyridoxal phosphate-dependent enzyme, partial [Pseudomonadota bacterium]
MLADAMERLGTETAFEVLARAGQLAAQGHDVINLGIGQPDFKTPEHIVEAGVQALRDGHHGYTEAQGILPLRESVSNKLYQRYGVEIDPGNVLIVPGGKVTMFMAILMMGQLGAEIIYPDPGFPIYRSMIQFTGARAVPMPLRESNGFGLDADELLSLVSDKTRLIIINSPSNPAGGITERDQFDKLAEGLRKYPDLIIMSDEIYDHMVYEGKEHVCMLGYPEFRDRTILLNGWSKTF